MKYDGDTVKEWAGDSQWRAWRADLARYRVRGYEGYFSEGFWAITIYRLQRSLQNARPKALWLPLIAAVGLAKKILTVVTHINLHPKANIGPGLFIPHVGPIRVSAWATIGADCAIHHVCTIGAGSKPGGPTIGDHVMIGCHTCILGPVNVGDYVQVGAGAVVVTDIPAHATAVGVPATAVFKKPTQPALVEMLSATSYHGLGVPEVGTDVYTAPTGVYAGQADWATVDSASSKDTAVR